MTLAAHIPPAAMAGDRLLGYPLSAVGADAAAQRVELPECIEHDIAERKGDARQHKKCENPSRKSAKQPRKSHMGTMPITNASKTAFRSSCMAASLTNGYGVAAR